MSLTKRQSQMMTLFCVSAPSFMLQLDANIVSVSLPAIAKSLHASFAGIEWVITAYTLSFASLLMPAGALADRFGRKELLMIGLAIFTTASLLCGLAPNLPILVAARAFQGVGAALQISAALAMLSHSFQGEARARAFSLWGAVIGIGIASGPIIGGLITQGFGWEWAFYVNVPLGVVLILMIGRFEETSRDPQANRIDLPGVATFSGFLFLTTLALISGNHDGWTSTTILTEGAAALALLVVFVVVELRRPRPMLELKHFRRSTLQGVSLSQLAFAGGLLTMLTYLPVYFQSALGFGPAKAGMLMVPMVIPMFVVPWLGSRYLAHRLSGRAILTIGLLFDAAGLGWLAASASAVSYAPMIGGMVLGGIGAGLLTSETAKVSMTVLPADRAGMASGLSATTRFSGLVVGFAMLGAVLFGRIGTAIGERLPQLSAGDRSELVRAVAAGDLSGGGVTGHPSVSLHAVALESFAAGYQTLLLVAAIASLIAAGLVWRLVRAEDTPPARRMTAQATARVLVDA